MADDTRGTTPPATGSSAAPLDPAAGRHDPDRLDRTHHDHDRDRVDDHGRQDTVVAPPVTHDPGYDPDHDHGYDHDRHRTQQVPAAAPVAHPVDRDGDGIDDRTGAAVPATAKEMAAVQRARYGGLHMGSAFFGWMSAVGIAVILLAVLSAAGLAFGLYSTLGSAQDAADQANTGIGLGAAIALLVVLFIAYLAGGYVAGRMARFNGTKQGLGVWLWGVIVTVLAALAGLVLGTQYNVFDQLNLPALPVESGTATTAGFIALGAVLVVTLLGAMLGGKLGSRYHRKVDRAGFEAVAL
ncbi:YrzE family protein [Klenkia sp. LSe6-5]|uniref:YrzE family protein n=1 Tax=Klenkia sesuvii TaxID=3103137 RepID=A0ABU8DVQ9_9ACTN